VGRGRKITIEEGSEGPSNQTAIEGNPKKRKKRKRNRRKKKMGQRTKKGEVITLPKRSAIKKSESPAGKKNPGRRKSTKKKRSVDEKKIRLRSPSVGNKECKRGKHKHTRGRQSGKAQARPGTGGGKMDTSIKEPKHHGTLKCLAHAKIERYNSWR